MRIKNAIVMATSSGCECDTWMLIMSELKQRVGIHPRYFIYYDEDKLQQGKNDFLSNIEDEVFFHNEFDNYKGRGYYEADKKNVLDDNLLRSISNHELIALRMMDRFDPLSNAFTFTNRQYYFRELVLNWLDIIDELKIEIFISPDVPHRVSDYALYVACTIKKIDFIFFEPTPFGDASFINDCIDDYDASTFEAKASSQINNRNDLIKSKLNSFRGIKDNYKLWYMEDQVKKANVGVSTKAFQLAKQFVDKGWVYKPVSVFNAAFKKERFSFYVKPHSMPYYSSFNLFDKRVVDFKTSRKSKSYLPVYNKIVEDVNLKSTKYVIFALHYQPEATTSPNGGVYVDQLLVISMLDRLLPPDVHVLVKDHKSQFYGVLESPSAGRSQIFYDRLQQFSSRVKVVPLDLNSFDLIDNAEAVVTVTGTIGIESLARNKPVFCFGRTWYQNCKGAFRIKDKEDLLAAWNSVNHDDFVITNKEVDEYVNNMAKYFIWGLHSGVYKKISKRNQQETVTNVVSGIICFLKNKSII